MIFLKKIIILTLIILLITGCSNKTSQVEENKTKPNKIVEEANVSADTRVKDLTDDELGRIREVVDGYKVEGDLRREQNLNIKRLMEISSYRGIRHRRGLPVRGQKTKNNARTRKGPVKTVANKKK